MKIGTGNNIGFPEHCVECQRVIPKFHKEFSKVHKIHSASPAVQIKPSCSGVCDASSPSQANIEKRTELRMYVTIMCRNYKLSSTISWVGSEIFILFAENSQILFKISVISIPLTFIYMVALNLLVNNQLKSKGTQLIIAAHDCQNTLCCAHPNFWTFRLPFHTQQNRSKETAILSWRVWWPLTIVGQFCIQMIFRNDKAFSYWINLVNTAARIFMILSKDCEAWF